MTKQHKLDWPEINSVGETLGATKANRAKWKQRGVPASWQVSIAKHYAADGKIVDLHCFEGIGA